MSSDEFWMMIDDALDRGQPIEELIPRDLSGLSEMEYIQVLGVMITYGNDKKRVADCRRKLIEYESRRKGIL